MNKAEVAGLQVEINRELKEIQIKERKRSRSNMFFKRSRSNMFFKRSCSNMFFKIGTLKSFSNFTGKQLLFKSLFNIVTGPQA